MKLGAIPVSERKKLTPRSYHSIHSYSEDQHSRKSIYSDWKTTDQRRGTRTLSRVLLDQYVSFSRRLVRVSASESKKDIDDKCCITGLIDSNLTTVRCDQSDPWFPI